MTADSLDPIPDEALLFDLDGTLINSGDDLADAVNHTLGVLGFSPLDPEEIISYVGDGVQMLIRRSLEGASNDSLAVDKALDIFLSYYRDNCTVKTGLYPGALETLEQLRSSYKLVILTNKGEEMARLILKKLQLDHLFVAVIGGNTLAVKKPDPGVVDHLSELLAIPKDKMVMIGDHHTDLATAQAAHIPSIFCSFGMGQKKGLIPTATVTSFSEIPAALTRL